MKRLLTILGCLAAAALIVFGIPYFTGEGENTYAQIGEKERSLISQNSAAGTTLHEICRIYDSGKLIGLITEGLVAESTNSNATMLDIYELNYLLSRTLVKDLMITNVKTIHPDVLLEEARNPIN